MPIYEYECRACGKTNELLQKLGEKPPKACAGCGKGPLLKIISRTVAPGRGGPETPPERDWIAEHNAAYAAEEASGNFVRDDSGHRVEVDADDPRLKPEKAS